VVRAEASPTHPGGRRAKKIRWGQIFIVFLKFEVKNRSKSTEEAKA